MFTPATLFAAQRQHRSRQVHGHYACDPIAQRLGPNVHHAAASRWPAVPDSLISHYCVTVVASLSTPSVMYSLRPPGTHKPKQKVKNSRQILLFKLQHHLVANGTHCRCFDWLKRHKSRPEQNTGQSPNFWADRQLVKFLKNYLSIKWDRFVVL